MFCCAASIVGLFFSIYLVFMLFLAIYANVTLLFEYLKIKNKVVSIFNYNKKKYKDIKLLGHGKGGYSYHVECITLLERKKDR